MKTGRGLLLVAVVALGVCACSSGGSSSSGGGCTNWMVSQDGAVVAAEVQTGTGGCDDGNLITQSAGTLTHVSGVPAHGSQECSVPVLNGIGYTVYAGPDGDPNGEGQGVCAMFNNG
jgi:hypothetical protein